MKQFQNPQTFYLLSPVGIIIAAFLLFYGSLSIAAPTITWTPSKVSQTISPGASTVMTLSFMSSKNINDVVVRVVPELQPFIQTNPIVFESIPKGQLIQIDLIISAPDDSQLGAFDGTVQLRSVGKPKKNYAKPLPVIIAVEPAGLPPDPGDAGKATLEGIDSDRDGVRDDIQRYIALTYPDSARTRAAFMEHTKNWQKKLIVSDDKEASKNVLRASLHSLACIAYLHENFSDITEALEVELINTEERLYAFFAYNDQTAGDVYPVPHINDWKASCSFDPDAMEN